MCILFSYYKDFWGVFYVYLFCLLWIYYNIIYYYSVGMEIYIYVYVLWNGKFICIDGVNVVWNLY